MPIPRPLPARISETIITSSPSVVIPAQAGIQGIKNNIWSFVQTALDPRLRGDDDEKANDETPMKNKPRPKGSVVAALDIGSTKIACFIARITDDEGNYEVLGVGHQASAGVLKGTITDLNAAEVAIRQTVQSAERMAAEVMKGYPLREVIINVPGVHVKSHNFTVGVDMHGHTVTDNDIRRALAKAQDHAVGGEFELVHTIPTGFSMDNHPGIRDPRGMVGEHIEVGVHLVTADLGALRNMATCIGRSHLDITAICHDAYAAGLSTLVEDEMELGCAVINMGGGVTSLAIFQGGSMVYCDAIPVGGQHVTNDIARCLTTSVADAERLKTLYGSATASSTDDSELIDVPQIGETDHIAPNHVPRAIMIGFIQQRLEEIFEIMRDKIKNSGFDSAANRRVVLTGGACQLPGMRDLAQHILDKQVRLGKLIRANGLAEAVNGPAFATTAGLLTYLSERMDEMPGEIMAQVEPGSLWERVRLWMKENW
jgi:cell division protein FtsA